MDEMRVLVVDDDFQVARVHAAAVGREQGFMVVGVAHSGADALRMAAELAPDLVLLDVYLPDMGGIEVARRLRAGCDAEIIMVTAARDARSVQSALHLGALHYLIKPFGMAELRRRLVAFRELERGSRGLPRQAGQGEVDAVFSLRGHAAPPVGLANPTLATVLEIVQESSGGISATEVATRIGISRPTAQRYLSQLESAGRVVRTLRYGSTGRPENRYRVP